MSYIKHYYSEYFENLELLEESEALRIFTSFEIEPCRKCVWSYEFYGETDEELSLIKEELGSAIICDCQECKKFGKKLFEYYSVFMALSSIKDKFPGFKYYLWAHSEEFMNNAKENRFARFGEIYECGFLKILGKNLAFTLLNVYVNYRSSETPEGAPF